MIVVSDSTTLIILSDLGRLVYLKNIFKHILIPPKVYEEINFKKEFSLPEYMEIIHPKESEQLQELKMLLDDGESEAIALALEKGLPLVIDEKKGRRIAKNLSLDIIGLLGIIYLNIKKGFINVDEAKKFLDKAQVNNYRISHKLIKEMFARL